MMEEYFISETILKAVSMDTAEECQQKSSMVDDTFYIVKKSVRRAISSSSIAGVCAVLSHACSILGGDYYGVLHVQLCAGYPSGFDFQRAYSLRRRPLCRAGFMVLMLRT